MANLTRDKFTEVIFNINNGVSIVDLNVLHNIVAMLSDRSSPYPGIVLSATFNKQNTVNQISNVTNLKEEIIALSFDKLVSLGIIDNYLGSVCQINPEIYYDGPESKRARFISEHKERTEQHIRINQPRIDARLKREKKELKKQQKETLSENDNK